MMWRFLMVPVMVWCGTTWMKGLSARSWRSAIFTDELEGSREVFLVPPDVEQPVAALAPHVGGSPEHRGAIAAVGTDGVVGPPVGRQSGSVVGAWDHGPALRRGGEDLDERARHGDRIPFHVYDDLERGDPEEAVPSATTQVAVDVRTQPYPLPPRHRRTSAGKKKSVGVEPN